MEEKELFLIYKYLKVRRIPGKMEKINAGSVHAALVYLTYIHQHRRGPKCSPIWLTKCEATQLENNARWYGSGKRCRSVFNPTSSTSVLGIARRMTPFLVGRSSNRAELSNSACKLLSVNESSSEIRVRDFVPCKRECSRQMQWNSSAAFSVILVWTSFT